MIKEVLQQLEPLDAQIDALSGADDGEMLDLTAHAAELAELAAQEDALLQRCTALTPEDRVFLARRPDRPHIDEIINAHGTSTHLNDSCETAAIKSVFGDHAYRLAVSSTKSMTGHLLGGAGGVEGVFTALALYDGFLPATVNLQTPDPALDLDYIPNTGRNVQVDYAISDSLGFGGHNACIVLKRWEDNHADHPQ